MTRTLVVWREELGLPSERFVVDSLRYVAGWSPLFAGFVARSELDVPTVTATTTRFRKLYAVRHRTLGPGRSLVSRLKSQDAAAILAHFGPDGVSALPLARRLGIPLAVIFHGYDLTTPDVELMRAARRSRQYVTRRTDLVRESGLLLPVSSYLASILRSQGYPSNRIVTHYLGVDSSRFRPKHSESDRRGVLFVGRLIPLKGVDLLLRAYAALPAYLREIHPLTVVGDGPERPPLTALAERLGVRVQWRGRLPEERVVATLQQAAIFVAPSRRAQGREEGAGLAALEAAACGIPVLAARSGGLPEMMVDGVTGLLFQRDDASDLAAKLRALLEAPERLAQMGQAGREWAVREMDAQVRGRALSELLDRLVADEG